MNGVVSPSLQYVYEWYGRLKGNCGAALCCVLGPTEIDCLTPATIQQEAREGRYGHSASTQKTPCIEELHSYTTRTTINSVYSTGGTHEHSTAYGCHYIRSLIHG